MMVRTSFLEKIDFFSAYPRVECFSIMESARKNNVGYDYLDKNVLIKEVRKIHQNIYHQNYTTDIFYHRPQQLEYKKTGNQNES